MPNIAISGFTTSGAIVDGTLLVLAPTSGPANTLNVATTVATCTGFGFDVAQLGAQYVKHRVVAYGARIRALPGVASAGEIAAAVYPASGMAPNLSTYQPAVGDHNGSSAGIPSYWSATGPRNTMESYLLNLGLPYIGTENAAVINPERIVNYPQHATVSLSEVAARGMHLRGLPYDSTARVFRSLQFSANGTDAVDVGFSTGTTNSYATQEFGVDMSAFRVGGLESMVLVGTGLPASTQVATLEIIYHVEATINPNYSLLARPTGQAPVQPPTATLDQVLTKLHRIPRISFADVVTQVGDSILGELEGRAAGAATRGLESVAGMLARLTMASV